MKKAEIRKLKCTAPLGVPIRVPGYKGNSKIKGAKKGDFGRGDIHEFSKYDGDCLVQSPYWEDVVKPGPAKSSDKKKEGEK